MTLEKLRDRAPERILEKAVKGCPRARREINSARKTSRTASLLSTVAGGVSGTGLGLYLSKEPKYQSESERKSQCWTFQGIGCGFLALAIIMPSAQNKHIKNSVKYYNEDL